MAGSLGADLTLVTSTLAGPPTTCKRKGTKGEVRVDKTPCAVGRALRLPVDQMLGHRGVAPPPARLDLPQMILREFRSLGRDLSGSSSRRSLQCFRPISGSLSARLPALIATDIILCGLRLGGVYF